VDRLFELSIENIFNDKPYS